MCLVWLPIFSPNFRMLQTIHVVPAAYATDLSSRWPLATAAVQKMMPREAHSRSGLDMIGATLLAALERSWLAQQPRKLEWK